MAKYELPIYGENDEIIKRYSTNIIPWGMFIKAADIAEHLENMSQFEQMKEIGAMLQKVFKGLTQEELEYADSQDVMNTFKQVSANGEQIKSNSNSKN